MKEIMYENSREDYYILEMKEIKRYITVISEVLSSICESKLIYYNKNTNFISILQKVPNLNNYSHLNIDKTQSSAQPTYNPTRLNSK